MIFFFALFKGGCKTFLVFEQNIFVKLNGKGGLKIPFGNIVYNSGSKDVREVRI